MPALVLFGRRWLIAGDDVPAPASCIALFHLVWVSLLIAWLAEIKGPEDCEGVGPYYVAVGGLLAAFALSLVLEVAAALVGLRGSIFETEKRAALPAIIYTNIACVLAQIAFNGYATHLLYTEPPQCSPEGAKPWNPVDVLYGLVWSTWGVIVGLIGLVVAAYNLFPDYQSAEQWEDQCECLSTACCGAWRSKSDHGVASKRLGALFALMFSHIDLTPSDILVSFGLALNRQRFLRRVAYRQRNKTPSSKQPRRRPAASSVALGGMQQLSMSPERQPERTSPASSDGLLQDIEMGPDPGSSGSAALGGAHSSNDAATAPQGPETNAQDQSPEIEPVDAESLAEAAYFMKYAFAAYGWMLFVWQRRTTGCLQLCCGRTCGLWASLATRRRGAPANVLKAPYLNTEAILQAAELPEQDLVFVRLEGEGTNVLPYFVALDHAKQAVVIAIRGSLSMEDVVRDLLFEPADLDEWVQGGEEWGCPLPPLRPAGSSTRYAAHSGIHEAARATLADIQSCGHLMDLVQGPTARGAGYRVVVCGHSLGAGCAFLISLYLKKFFPSLRCLAFSPPGGLATAELCAGTQDWCTSTVCGKEMIPRLTLATFERVRDELVACAARCRRPKVSLMLGWLTGRVWADSELFYSDDELPDEPRRWLERYRESLAATAAKRAYVETAAKFGPPGKVMYLKPTGVKHKQRTGLLRLSTKTDREYRCQWADGQELMEKGVLLSGRMMKDHMPDYCLGLLQRLAEAAAAEASTASISDAVGESEVGRVSAQVPGQARPSFDGDDRSS